MTWSIGIVVAVLLVVFTFIALNHRAHAMTGSGRLVTIHDRGVEKVLLSEGETIGDALENAGITLDSHDVVEPAVTQKLIASEYQINIYRARPVTVVDGPTRQRVVTAYQTAEQIAKDAGVTLYAEDETKITRSSDFINDGAGLQVAIDRATAFNFTLYGKSSEARTQSSTVGGMLKDKGVTLAENDRVSVPISTPIVPGLDVRVWREGKQTITVDEEIDFTIEKIQDADQEVGYRQVTTAGEKGQRHVTYEVTIQDGQETGRTEIASITATEPKKQVEVIGSKSKHSGSLNEWLLALRTCETGGVYTRNSGNGFFGAYQFMVGTWDSVAPKVGRPDLKGVRPDMASPADQDFMVVANANLSKGGLATQHPGCYKKLGLAQFPPK